MDWKIRQGGLKMLTGRRFPRGLGHDFAGVVEAVGPSVARFKVGDEVFGATGLKEAGTFAEAVVVEEKTTFLKPATLSFEQAAALPIASATAWNALVSKAKLRVGQQVLITGCLGSVGRVAVQIARLRGAEVVGTCSAAGFDEARANSRRKPWLASRRRSHKASSRRGSAGPWGCPKRSRPSSNWRKPACPRGN